MNIRKLAYGENSNSLALRSEVRGRQKEQPLVAVLDNYRPDPVKGASHGERVESVLLSADEIGEEQIQSYWIESGWSIPPEKVIHSPSGEILDSLSQYLQTTGASFLDSVSDSLALVLEQPTVQAVNLSQSQSFLKMLTPFVTAIPQNAEFLNNLGNALEVTHGKDRPRKVLQALLDYAAKELDRPDTPVEKSTQRYAIFSKLLHQRGTNIVISAGNLGAEIETMRQLGYQVPPKLARSFLVNQFVTIVGAASEAGAVSSFTTLPEEAELFFLGENIKSVKGSPATGTSFAAPLAVLEILKVQNRFPDLDAQSVEDHLRHSSFGTYGGPISPTITKIDMSVGTMEQSVIPHSPSFHNRAQVDMELVSRYGAGNSL